MGYADLIEWHIPQNFSLMDAIHNLLFLVFYYLPIIHTILIEEFYNCIFVLVIAISAETYFAVVSRLLSSLGNLFIKLIASILNPFSDGKCHE